MKLLAIGMNVYRIKDKLFDKLTNNDEEKYGRRKPEVERLMEWVEQNMTPIMVLDEIINY